MNATTRPGRAPVPAMSPALPRLIRAPGLTMTWRPSAVSLADRVALARLVLDGSGYQVVEATLPARLA